MPGMHRFLFAHSFLRVSSQYCLVRFRSDNVNVDVDDTRFRKKPALGSRFLTDNRRLFDFNAWYITYICNTQCSSKDQFLLLWDDLKYRDNVEWDDEQDEHARASVAKNSNVTIGDEQLEKYESDADKFWDTFYDVHQNRFFKDRHWLFTEFPELAPDYTGPGQVCVDDADDAAAVPSSSSGRRIFELGCGVGNTIFPILKYSTDSTLRVFGCDFSATAIDIMNGHDEMDADRLTVFVMDATSDEWRVPFEENSMDFIILIFVLSAIHPKK